MMGREEEEEEDKEGAEEGRRETTRIKQRDSQQRPKESQISHPERRRGPPRPAG